MIEVYSKCGCGQEGIKIRQIRKYAIENNIDFIINKTGGNSNKETTQEHFEYLRVSGIGDKALTGIYVQDGEVKRLKEWSS